MAFYLKLSKRLKTYNKTYMRLPQAQQRSIVQNVKKTVRSRWLILDGIEPVYKEYIYLLIPPDQWQMNAYVQQIQQHQECWSKLIKFLPALLYVLALILPHPSPRAIYCTEEVRENKQSLKELKKDLVSCYALCQKVLTVDKRTT